MTATIVRCVQNYKMRDQNTIFYCKPKHENNTGQSLRTFPPNLRKTLTDIQAKEALTWVGTNQPALSHRRDPGDRETIWCMPCCQQTRPYWDIPGMEHKESIKHLTSDLWATFHPQMWNDTRVNTTTELCAYSQDLYRRLQCHSWCGYWFCGGK